MTGLFLKLAGMSFSAAWIIVAVILLRFAFKRAPKWVRCVMWALVAVRLILPVSIESPLSIMPPLPDTLRVELNETQRDDLPDAVYTEGTYIAHVESAEQIVTAGEDNISQPLPLSDIFSCVWIIGVAAMLIYALISWLRIKRQVGASIPLRDNILLCDGIGSPFILGVIKPHLYLPSDIGEIQLSLVTEHENAHIARGDHIWKPLGFLLLAVYWFNPLVWAAYVLFCRDMELACDERVICNMEKSERIEYSQTLLDYSSRRRRMTVSPLAFGETKVKDRIKSVLSYRKSALWIIALAVVVCAALAICMLTDPMSGREQTVGEFTFSKVLSDKLIENWKKWDEMDEVTRIVQSTLPGYSAEDFNTWDEATNFLGVALWNPLEDADWLVKKNYLGADVVNTDDWTLKHAFVSWMGERNGTVTGANIMSGYSDGDVRVTLDIEPLFNPENRAETNQNEQIKIGDITAYLTRDSGEEYDAESITFVYDRSAYEIRIISFEGETALNETFQKVCDTIKD